MESFCNVIRSVTDLSAFDKLVMMYAMPIAFFGGSIGSGEFLLILAVALIVFGPQKLPSIARTLGRLLSDLRRSAREFSDELTRATRENEDTSPPTTLSSKKTGDEKDAPG